MEKGKNFNLAKKLSLDYVPYVMDAIRNDFSKNYHYIDLLLPDQIHVEELVRLFEENLPLGEMATGTWR